jgi:ATP-dependent Clp protease ATP-binding subunit ClpA
MNRFTTSARQAVIVAVGHARRSGAARVEAEHLLRAVLEQGADRLADLDAAQWTQVEARIARARRRAGLSPADTEALAGLGIDVDAVVERAEAELGTGALDGTAGRSGRRLRMQLSDECREVLRSAARQAAARGEHELGVRHLLLGLVAGRGVVADVLHDAGVTVATVLARSAERRAG